MAIHKHLASEIRGETVELTPHLKIFSLHSHKGKRTKEKLDFIKSLHSHSKPEHRIDEKGSAVYFFKAGDCAIQLDVLVGDSIDIKPYLVYQPESVAKDLEKIITLGFLIHSAFKSAGLQI